MQQLNSADAINKVRELWFCYVKLNFQSVKTVGFDPKMQIGLLKVVESALKVQK